MFARQLLPALEHVRGRAVRAAQFTVGRCCETLPFADVRALDWELAIDRLEAASREGVNTILLSEEFQNWNTTNGAINEDLASFEDTLEVLSVDVLSLESFSDKQMGEFPERFDRVSGWHEAAIVDVLKEMLRDHVVETLVWPYGNLPYILLDPKLDESRVNSKDCVRAWVGFQPWQYERVLSRWPVSEFPMKHVTARVQGRAAPENLGAVPLALRMTAD